jgi:aconitase A
MVMRPAADLSAACPADMPSSTGHGDVLIASITSCTNTSNPALLIAAGLFAKRANERGTINPRVNRSRPAPSRHRLSARCGLVA